MRPFNVLDRQESVLGAHFLEASAGTGKTFAIEHWVTRLLLEEEAPLKIDQILVMTFTRAATRELKVRIRHTVVRILSDLEEQKSSYDYVQALCERGRVEAAKRRLEEALSLFDQAQIFTLHAFCHRMLSEFAFEAGVHLDVTDPEAKEAYGILRKTVREFFRSDLCQTYCAAQIDRLLAKHRYDLGALEKRIVKLLEMQRPLLQLPSFSALLEQFQSALQAFAPICPVAWANDIERLAPCYTKIKRELLVQQTGLLGEVLTKKKCSRAEFEALLACKEWEIDKMRDEHLKARLKGVPQKELCYPGLLGRVQEHLLGLLKQAADPARVLLSVASECQKRAHEQMHLTEKTTPDALLLKMQEALKSSAFVSKLRQKYQAVVIDEFQDTDKVQWEIFRTLFFGSARAFCLVGDPKQSIYGFRGADVYTYLEAAHLLGKTRSLATNYRSSPPLVKALNRLFASKYLPGGMSLPRAKKALEVFEVEARPTSQCFGIMASVHFVIAEAKSGRERWPTRAVEEEYFFPFFAQEILELQGKGIVLQQIAILVRDRYQAARASAFLKQEGIASSVRRGESLAESVGHCVLTQFLQAVTSPQDQSLLKKALGGPLFGWTAEQLQDGEAVFRAKERFYSYQEEFHLHGVGALFQMLLADSLGTEISMLESLCSRGDLSLYLQMRQSIEHLIEQEKKTGRDLPFLLQFLEEISLKEEMLLRVEEEEGVHILTMHMSKGLEFEVVFALGVASRTEQEIDLLCVQKGPEALVIPFSPQECEEELLEQDAEKMRQLYVALTRAKQKVYIPLAFDTDNRPVALGKASPVELFCAQHAMQPVPVTLQQFLPTLEKICAESAATYTLLQKQGRNRRPSVAESSLTEPAFVEILPFPQKSIVSFSSLQKKEIPHAWSGDVRTGEIPLGAETGVIVHHLFEKIFAMGLHHPLQEEEIIRWVACQVGASALKGWEGAVAQMILQALRVPLSVGESAFALVQLPREKMFQEMEFLFPRENTLVKGFADLVFEWQGRYYLLDWKTNYLDSYTEENVERAMQENQYFLQASLYTEALKRYVKLFDTRPFQECFGGAFYFFVRGPFVYTIRGDRCFRSS